MDSDSEPHRRQMEIYLHIPFCASACDFCFYAKTVGASRTVRLRYLAALEREIEYRWNPYRHDPPLIRSVYVGGGTPSLLGPDEWETLGNMLNRHLDLSRVAEFTVECNPAISSRPKFEVLSKIGVNRLSWGVQILDDHVLTGLGRSVSRAGSAEALRRNVQDARAVGIDNLNCDLLMGLPGETAETVAIGLDLLFELEIPHISVYPLQVSAETPLFVRLLLGQIKSSPRPERLHRYQEVIARLERSGYTRLGIAYFVRSESYACRQHRNIWNGGDFMGFGVSGQSFEAGRVARNHNTVDAYLRSVPARVLAVSWQLGVDDLIRRWALMRLSKTLGFRSSELAQTWGERGQEILAPAIDAMVAAGLARNSDDGVWLTEDGIGQTERLPIEFLHFEQREYCRKALHARVSPTASPPR
ncbi:MAG: coproporphyrinogen III oxidase family protein [Zoogloeaceae bacterium]|nr:coproporphyrinogen III oxidase family protein [Zoogloeaceae bacterium]